jgi:hypothetical protein
VAQIELWKEKDSGKYDKKVYVLPKVRLDYMGGRVPTAALLDVLRCDST